MIFGKKPTPPFKLYCFWSKKSKQIKKKIVFSEKWDPFLSCYKLFDFFFDEFFGNKLNKRLTIQELRKQANSSRNALSLHIVDRLRTNTQRWLHSHLDTATLGQQGRRLTHRYEKEHSRRSSSQVQTKNYFFHLSIPHITYINKNKRHFYGNGPHVRERFGHRLEMCLVVKDYALPFKRIREHVFVTSSDIELSRFLLDAHRR